MYPYPGGEGGFLAPPPGSWQVVLTAMAEPQKVSRTLGLRLGTIVILLMFLWSSQ